MLFLDISEITSDSIDVAVIFLDDVLESFKLLYILKNNLIKIVFHDVDLDLELKDLSFKLLVSILPLLILLLGFPDLSLQSLLVSLALLPLHLELLALLLHLSNDLLLVVGEVLADDLLLGLDSFHFFELTLIHVGLQSDIAGHVLLILLLHGLLLPEQVALRPVDLVHVLLLDRGEGELVGQHGDDELHVVYLGVERFGVASALAELLEELDALHFGVVNQVHVLHFLGNELAFQICGLGVSLVDLGKVVVVVVLQLLPNLSYLLLLDSQLVQLDLADLAIEVQGLPFGIKLHLWVC